MPAMEAIYQRARPATFGEVVGQEHVKELLTAALHAGRTGHAYLFSGPRGVGKTTTARLLAMALNCESDDPTARPCGRCEACVAIRGGRHPDVVELDAASNNSVEDVRELRERVRLASLRGGTRVWILDEAHMLSTAAANALLKTLEEPPPGLVFVLATTEPERLPPTVLSRCQHFRFRRLSVPEIAGKLAGLCEAAGAEAEPAALELVARAAEGAMRDAESLLERLLAGGGPIGREAAEAALGLPPRDRLEALAEALAADALDELLAGATALYRDGFSPRTVAEQLARTLRDAVVADVTGEEGFRVRLPRPALLRALHQFDDELERFVRHDDLYALEAALLKASNAAFERPGGLPAPAAAATQPAPASAAQPPASAAQPPAPAAQPAAPAAPPVATAEAGSTAEAPPERAATPADAPGRPVPAEPATPEPEPEHPAEPEPGRGPAASPPSPAAGGHADGAADEDATPAAPLSWHRVKSKASAQLKAFLQPADDEIAGGVVRLRYDERHRFHFGQLKARQDELMELIERVGGPGWTLLVEGPDETLRKKA
jgi:DNA polymerase-3 subunit gamma/tau